MSEGGSKPWRRRCQLPDEHIRDAADQYEAARRLLAAQPPGSGVVLPLINCAAMAIELYLKCLSAERVYSPVDGFSGLSTVSASPLKRGHKLVKLFDAIPADVRKAADKAFRDRSETGSPSLRDRLNGIDGAFADSRYPFEKEADVSKYPLKHLMQISASLSEFVAGLPPKEWIEWD